MPNLRDIKKRINSVESTKQITRTMEMVATAKIRHATNRLDESVPYAEAMMKALVSIAEQTGSSENPLFQEHEERKTAIAIVIVSDRGLAGGFNSNVLRQVDRYRAANEKKGIETKVIVCGKKGVSYFSYRGVEPLLVFRDLSADPTLSEAREISSYVRSAFVNGSADEVRLFFNHARNSADQDLWELQLLPFDPDFMRRSSSMPAVSEKEQDGEEAGKIVAAPEFEPSVEDVLDSLLPSAVETLIYQALIDSAAAEQGARRKAMKSATDNATEMTLTLNRLYNRVRQGAITTEITEIVGGAAALED